MSRSLFILPVEVCRQECKCFKTGRVANQSGHFWEIFKIGDFKGLKLPYICSCKYTRMNTDVLPAQKKTETQDSKVPTFCTSSPGSSAEMHIVVGLNRFFRLLFNERTGRNSG